jgi:general secretion pathway protein I
MTAAHHPAEAESGFTLFEVAVAFGVAAILLAALLQVFSTALGAARRGAAQTAAVLWAESLIDSAGADGPLQAEKREGLLPDGLRWQRTVQHAEPASSDAVRPSPVVPYIVSVTVRWSDGARERALTLETLRLKSGR